MFREVSAAAVAVVLMLAASARAGYWERVVCTNRSGLGVTSPA